MSDWQPIETVPKDVSVLVYDPTGRGHVFEALAQPDGRYYDPVYSEWDGLGVTHWMPLPAPPSGAAKSKKRASKKHVCSICCRGDNAWLNCNHPACSNGHGLVESWKP